MDKLNENPPDPRVVGGGGVRTVSLRYKRTFAYEMTLLKQRVVVFFRMILKIKQDVGTVGIGAPRIFMNILIFAS